MANTTFEVAYLYGAPTQASPAPGELWLDASGNLIARNHNSPDSDMTLRMRLRIDLVSMSEYRVTEMTTDGVPVVEHLGHPQKGHALIIHPRKWFVSGVKYPNLYRLAMAPLPLAILTRYNNFVATCRPNDLVWTVENHSAEQTTLALRIRGRLSQRFTFSSLTQMVTSFTTYDGREVEIDVIEAVSGPTAYKLPFIASNYKYTFRKTVPKLYQIIASTPLTSRTMKPFLKPVAYVDATHTQYVEHTRQEEAKARQKMKPSSPPAPGL